MKMRSKRMASNLDPATIQSFGDEWTRFDQSALTEAEVSAIFDDYFSLFPWTALPADAVGFDMGCGSGRWARLVAPHVGILHCIDPSSALEVAKRALSNQNNVRFHDASVDADVLPADSQDFGYSLGVLHHIPDTQSALLSCVKMLKPGAPFLLYLYYAFDNRPFWFRMVWKASDLLRRCISRCPAKLKHVVTDVIAGIVYFPLARFALLVERLGFGVQNFPLSYYRTRSFYTMRTDSRDRFGTPLEQRFTRAGIEEMMVAAGLKEIQFSERPPYWCAVGIKR